MHGRVTWSRPEPFGAWVRLDDATLVAVDATLAGRLGVAHGAHARIPEGNGAPLEVHVAVTERCPVRCDACYAGAGPEGHEPSFEEVSARLRDLAGTGVSTVAFGGGEPLARPDLGALAEVARGLGLVPVTTTSGVGLSPARARELRAFAQINVSHDGVGGAYESVRGWSGRHVAESALEMLAAAGIPAGVNMVLTRSSFEHVQATAERAADLGAGELQLLRCKPAGRALGMAYLERSLTPRQVDRLWSVIAAVVAARRVRVRIDCAMVSLLSGALGALGEGGARALEALGVLGCEAGGWLGALSSQGAARPCSFWPASEAGPERDLEAIRAYHAGPPEPCASCALFAVCRGGCQVVSRHARAAFAPDPECPRVAAAAAGAHGPPLGS